MVRKLCSLPRLVNCRIGSLEKFGEGERAYLSVNCRIGSLEKYEALKDFYKSVNCRIGSLENPGRLARM